MKIYLLLILFESALMASALQALSTGANSSNSPIEGIDQPIILQYFRTFNAGDFDATSQLFATEGMLQPPFEAMVIGSPAIAAYLNEEAKGFVLVPQRGKRKELENGDLKNGDTGFLVLGRVQTPLFTVNAS